MLYTLFATNPYYNLELLYTKDLDEAMKAGAMFGKVQENLVVYHVQRESGRARQAAGPLQLLPQLCGEP